MKVAIIGSCVTRDLFEFNIVKMNNFQVTTYISRATTHSIVADISPFYVTLDNYSMDTFNERKFLEDFKKEYFNLLKNNDWDILLLDFIDERHKTYIYNTFSLTYTKSSKKFIDEMLNFGKGNIYTPLSQEMIDKTKIATFKLIPKLINIAKGRPIFLHKAKYATKYIDSTGQLKSFEEGTKEKIDKNNIFLDDLYALYALYNNSQIKFIDVEPKIGGGNCKWDLQPFHYDKQYYENFATELYNLSQLK